MKRIIRRIITRNLLGRLLSQRQEELKDDEQGNIEEVHTSDLAVCEACGRPLEKVDDVRGRCTVCGLSCCVTCSGSCSVCHRHICAHCSLGFPEKSLTVCGECLAGLEARLARLDRLQEEKILFDKLMSLYGSQMQIAQQLASDRGSLLGLLGRIAQFRLIRKLNNLERRIGREDGRGKRLLP